MSDFDRELPLSELPEPPLYGLVDGSGGVFLWDAEVSGEPGRKVCAFFAERQVAEVFVPGAEDDGPEEPYDTVVRELPDWRSVEQFAASGADYALFVSERGSGLFHAGDVAHHAAKRAGGMPFPLYVVSDERGEAPLISVDANGETVMVAALFSSPGKARAFREQAAHLDLPGSLGTIDSPDGLRRHALVAREAGADYAVLDPESGLTDAIPIEDLTG
jgi:hypothetical protein